MNKIFIQLLMLFSVRVSAQFPVASLLPISESLMKNAHSVKREETIVFDIKAVDKAYYKVHKLVTVLDESAKEELYFLDYADKFRSLEEVSIVLYSTSGEIIKKYGKKDMTSFNAGEGLVSDSKIYLLDVPNSTYPINIQVDYEVKYNGLLQYPTYQVQNAEQSVEKVLLL